MLYYSGCPAQEAVEGRTALREVEKKFKKKKKDFIEKLLEDRKSPSSFKKELKECI